MNKFRTAAIKILNEVNKPIHYKEITKLVSDKGILETIGDTPDASSFTISLGMYACGDNITRFVPLQMSLCWAQQLA